MRLLSNDFNFQLQRIGVKVTPPGLLKTLICARAETLGILHGNSLTFLMDHTLKRDLWMLFYDLENYPVIFSNEKDQELLKASVIQWTPLERAQRMSRAGVIRYWRNEMSC